MPVPVCGPKSRQTATVAEIEIWRMRGAHTLNLMCPMRFLIAVLRRLRSAKQDSSAPRRSLCGS